MEILPRRPYRAQLRPETDQRALADEAHTILQHWLCLTDAAKAQGIQPLLTPAHLYGEHRVVWPAAEIDRLNQIETLQQGRQVTAGGGIPSHKRAAEERPSLKPLFDDELAVRLTEVCAKHKLMPVTDGRTISECLYLHFTDAIHHLLDYDGSEYVQTRIEWIAGKRPRRPQWGALAKPERLSELDERATTLARHWLALHEALTGDLPVDVAPLLLHRTEARLLLTDVEQLSARQRWQLAAEQTRERKTLVLSRPSSLAGPASS
jgi:hypothetical protein